MKRSDVKIGGVYITKVTNRLVEVRIDAVSKYGGWTGTNLRTGKSVRVRTAAKLRSAVSADAVANNGKESKKGKATTKAKPAPTSTPNTETVANTKPKVCPNCGSTEVDEDGDCVKCHEPKIGGKTSEAGKATQPPKGKSAKPKRPSGLDAAAKILEETGLPMNVKEITEVAFAKGYWKPAGRTPSATLAAALIREIAKKGSQSRFCKSERGKFMLNR